ncbi:MAG: hypothetical protein E7112_00445 [Bacteroidales bacterium]|nr:hypothetical protein [Bacteroidales bacterium]
MYKILIKRFLLVLMFVLSVSSCRQREHANKNTNTTENLFKIDSVGIVTLHPMEAEFLEINDMFLAVPTALSYHKDNFLIINDGADAKQLVIVDLEKRTFCREIQKGRANNELINLWDVVVFNDDLFLSSINERKIIKMKYDSGARKFHFSESRFFPHQFLHCSPTNVGYLTFASASSGNRFVRWTESLEPIDTIGSYPKDGVVNYVDAENGALQSDFTFSPEGDRMAISYKNIDYIDLYEGDDLIKRIRGPQEYEVTVRTDNLGNGNSMTYVTPLHFAYKSISASSSGFWAGYIGLKPPSGIVPTQDMNRIREVYHFDWDGNLKRIYKFINPIEAFAINEDSNIMYCIQNDPEPVILMYKL